MDEKNKLSILVICILLFGVVSFIESWYIHNTTSKIDLSEDTITTLINVDFNDTEYKYYSVDIYCLNTSQIDKIAAKDEYNYSIYWIESYEERLVWVKLPNDYVIKTYVEDIDNLNVTYIFYDDFGQWKEFTWKEHNVTIDYISKKLLNNE